MDWETALIQWMQSFEHPIVSAVWTFFTMVGEVAPVLLVMSILYWSVDKHLGKKVIFALLISLLISNPIKSVVRRRRPYLDHEGINCRRRVSSYGEEDDVAHQGYSFPSSHTTLVTSAGLTIGFSQKNKVIRTVLVILPVFVGLSRLYMGVHYPTDVLMGLAVGAAGFLLADLMEKHIKREWVRYAVVAAAVLPFVVILRVPELVSVYGIAIGVFGGFLFEDRFVRFENTSRLSARVLRFFGGALFFAAAFLLSRLVFGLICGSGMIRDAFSAGIGAFVGMGFYPYVMVKIKFLN